MDSSNAEFQRKLAVFSLDERFPQFFTLLCERYLGDLPQVVEELEYYREQELHRRDEVEVNIALAS